MEILHGIVVIVVAGAAVIAFGVAVLVFYFAVQKLWPAMIGAAGGYYLWRNFDDDVSVVFALMCLVVQIFWWQHTKKDFAGPMGDPAVDKKKHHNEELYLPRYFDV